jgi:hypothetical protein
MVKASEDEIDTFELWLKVRWEVEVNYRFLMGIMVVQ